MKPVYMDHHATTPCDPRVVEAMVPYFTEHFGNAASRNHAFGWKAEEAVERAREQVAALIGASAKEIVFTSGATEADNLAIKGVVEMYGEQGPGHLVASVVEHSAVLDTVRHLERKGAQVTWLPVDAQGRVDPLAVRDALRDDTRLVCVMAANNEIGTVQPIAEIGAVCRERGVFLLTDAAQAAGRVPFDVEAMHVDLAALSAHKLYGPKGVGALYVRRKRPRVRLSVQMHGGGHERGMRSGTLNVPGIVGFGAACEIARKERDDEARRVAGLRDRLWARLSEALPAIYLNGPPLDVPDARLPNNLNVSFAYVEGESLLMGIPEVAVSSGSACTSASLEPSYVLKAIGVGDDLAHTSIRFGLGRFTTAAEVDFVAGRVIDTVRRLRAMSPLWEMVQEGVDLSQVTWTGH